MKIESFETTPNPAALKCVISAPPAGGIRAYRAAEEAEGDGLAERLFAVPGVSSLLIHERFITVVKTTEGKWGPIKRGVRAAVEVDG